MAETFCGVYLIKNTRNGKKYIGSTNDSRRRKREHFNELRGNKHHCDYLQNAWNSEKNKSVFVFSVFIRCPENFLEDLEQRCMDNMRPEYNSSKIAGRIEMTDRVREKISSALTGVPLSTEHKEKLRLAKLRKPSALKGRASPLRGRKGKSSKGRILGPPSEEHREKLRQAHLGRPGRPCSEDTKAKISRANKGRKPSETAIENSRVARKGKPAHNRGKPQTEEAKAKFKATWEAKRKSAGL